jgi:hypothetical protein
VVKKADGAELRIVVAAVLAAATDAALVAHHLPKLGKILLPHWPAYMCEISREKAA